MLMLILGIVLMVALVDNLPTWLHSRDWSYHPSGGLGLAAVGLLVLFILGRL